MKIDLAWLNDVENLAVNGSRTQSLDFGNIDLSYSKFTLSKSLIHVRISDLGTK